MYTYDPAPPTPQRPAALRTYTVTEGDRNLGAIALEINSRPAGRTPRRDWWPIEPGTRDTSRRPYGTRTAAAHHLSVRWHRAHQPPATPPEDRTLTAIRRTRDQAGTGAASWLAATITAHHFRELAANRQTQPAPLWREIARATTWLEAATL